MANLHPITHTLLYGEPGSGKSTAAATWPTPILVMMFEPFSKDIPYLKKGTPSGPTMAGDIRYQDVVDGDDRLLIRLEYYHDADPHRPKAYDTFLKRMTMFDDEIQSWATVIVDSVTFLELAARKHSQYVLNPHVKEPRLWYGGATDALEEILMIQFGAFPINVVVIAHVDKDKDAVHGEILRNPSAPGRLRYRLAAAYGELYHAFVTKDDKGQRVYGFQTQSDGRFHAASRIDAPNPCWPTYDALWPTTP